MHLRLHIYRRITWELMERFLKQMKASTQDYNAGPSREPHDATSPAHEPDDDYRTNKQCLHI